jgi:hypothetical protein
MNRHAAAEDQFPYGSSGKQEISVTLRRNEK